MALMLKRQRNGTLRDDWYGVYTESDGKRKVINLNEKIIGTPPASKLVGDAGDPEFEESRKRAQAELDGFIEEARRKGRADHLTERLIEAKTGRTVDYTRIDALSQRWRNIGRENPVTEGYLRRCDAVFRRFAAFVQAQNKEAIFLYQVTPEMVGAYIADLQKDFARKTINDNTKLLNKSFSLFLPVGSSNPFSSFIGKRSGKGNETVHRQPFTAQELQALFDVAKADDFMNGLITATACTGMRLGDVCKMRWPDVDLDAGRLKVKTSKTGATVVIPIFKPLKIVLEASVHKKSEFVFPDGEKMHRENPTGLTYRFKKMVAASLLPVDKTDEDNVVAAEDVLHEALMVVERELPEGRRKKRICETMRRYCSGESIRMIEKETECSKSTVSADLHAVQSLLGKTFMRSAQTNNTKASIARSTQTRRTQGKRAASIRDWHALRTTFVTLSLSAGVPIELVRRVTGHTTVEIVQRHYFQPDWEQFKAALSSALPEVLTGVKALPPPSNTNNSNPDNPITTEMDALLEKIRSGAANESDKARFRELAAQV